MAENSCRAQANSAIWADSCEKKTGRLSSRTKERRRLSRIELFSLALISLRHHNRLQQNVHEAQYNGAHESGEESAHMESRNQGRSQFQHQRINHEPEQAQGKQCQWK